MAPLNAGARAAAREQTVPQFIPICHLAGKQSSRMNVAANPYRQRERDAAATAIGARRTGEPFKLLMSNLRPSAEAQHP
jgi:hypothetical protein